MSNSETTAASRESASSAVLARLRKCFSFPVFLGVLLLAGIFVIGRPLRLDPDTWWHIKLGQDILTTGHVPRADDYSFTAHAAPWSEYEWLGDVVLALAGRAGGLRGLDILLIVMGGAIILLLYVYATLRSKDCKAAAVACVFVLPLITVCFTLRPQLIGYIFLLITLLCLERFRQGHPAALWVLPVVFLAWVNTHGSFVLGFIAISAYWAGGLLDFSWGGIHGERWNRAQHLRLGISTALCLLVLPLTPYGARLAIIPVEYAFRLPLNVAAIQEWQPANFNDLWGAKLVLFMIFAFLIAQICLRLKYRLEEMALFFFAAYSTFVHFRFVILFALIFAPILAVILSRWTPRYEPAKDHYVLNFVLITVACVGMVMGIPQERTLAEKVAEDSPVGAVDHLRVHPVATPMFNYYGYGGYLVWSRGPAHQVFIDGRGDLYENAGVLSDYLQIMAVEPPALHLLDKYKIQSCLIPRDAPLAAVLSALSEWKQVYADKNTVLFTRGPLNPSEPSALNAPVQAMPWRETWLGL